MNTGLLRSTALIVCAALLLPGCAPVSSEDRPGPFSGANATSAASGMSRGLGVTTGESLATGATTGSLVSATTTFIAKYQATERQREVALQRARQAVVRLERARRAEAAEQDEPAPRKRREAPRTARGDDQDDAPSAPRKRKDSPRADRTADRDEEPAPAPTAKRKPAKKKLPRYIAVDTVKSPKTSPRASRSVMIYDTEVMQIVGNNVYDVEAAPRLGETTRFETYVAEYVGTGN